MIERPPTLSTRQNGSIGTTGVSVEDITPLSNRLSRISIEWTWWRPSAGISTIGDGGTNDDMVDLAYAVMIVPTGSPLSARVKLPLFNPLMTWTERLFLAFRMSWNTVCSRTTSARSSCSSSSTVILGMNLALRSFFRISRVETVFVLDVDHGARPQ